MAAAVDVGAGQLEAYGGAGVAVMLACTIASTLAQKASSDVVGWIGWEISWRW